MNRGARKALRTVLQFIASGGLTALVNEVVVQLSASQKALVLAGFTVLVTFIQNAMEATGTIPTLLPTPVPPEPAAEQPLVAPAAEEKPT